MRRNRITFLQYKELTQCHLLMQKALVSVLAGPAVCRDAPRMWVAGWDLEVKVWFVFSDVH